MYKDIISYQLADGIDEQHLLKVASGIIESWMNKQSGFIQWDIHKNSNDDNYTDIVYWETQEDAKNSEKEMMNIPNAADWFACYKEGSINCLNLQSLGTFK
jgi:hypothetical protein